MSRARIVVVGAGVMGRRHIAYIEASECAELAAVCDRDAAAATLAAQYGVPHFYDYIEALDLASPDGAIIATPTQLHEEVALACIRRGIAPLVEKPIAASLDEGRSVVDEADDAGIPLLVGHHRRYPSPHPQAVGADSRWRDWGPDRRLHAVDGEEAG